jgi:hypothetical protein
MGKTHTNILHRFGYQSTKVRRRAGLFPEIEGTRYFNILMDEGSRCVRMAPGGIATRVEFASVRAKAESMKAGAMAQIV